MSVRDFWFRWLPAKWLAGTRMVSLEGRGAYADYISIMREGDGTLPDERTKDGLEWHCRMLAVRDGRTVKRVVGELLAKRKLRRLDDGRLTNSRVEYDMAERHKPRESTGDNQRQLSLVVNNSGNSRVDEMGTPGQSPDSRPTDGQQSPDSRPSRPKSPNEIRGRSDSVDQRRLDHESVAAITSRYRARARGDPPP